MLSWLRTVCEHVVDMDDHENIRLGMPMHFAPCFRRRSAGRPIVLSAMGRLPTLRSVRVDGDPTDNVGASNLVALGSLTDLTLNLRTLER